jgi:hypothetical protein
VIRLNPYVEDFQKDAFAYQHFSSKLPIPKMIKCDRVAYPKGNRFKQNYYFAITERCEGNTLNTLEVIPDNVPYKRLWQNWAESKNLSIDNFEQRMNCYMIHIGLASLAIAAIQDDLEDYTQVKERMKTVIATSY